MEDNNQQSAFPQMSWTTLPLLTMTRSQLPPVRPFWKIIINSALWLQSMNQSPEDSPDAQSGTVHHRKSSLFNEEKQNTFPDGSPLSRSYSCCSLLLLAPLAYPLCVTLTCLPLQTLSISFVFILSFFGTRRTVTLLPFMLYTVWQNILLF